MTFLVIPDEDDNLTTFKDKRKHLSKLIYTLLFLNTSYTFIGHK